MRSPIELVEVFKQVFHLCPCESLDRLELIRFLQIAQTLTVHHGALAYLLGINALRASEAAAVRIEDYADTLRGYRVLHLVGKGNLFAEELSRLAGVLVPTVHTSSSDRFANT